MSAINGTTNKVMATVPAGSDPSFATYDGGNGYVYVPNYDSASVSVISGTTNEVVATVPVGTSPYLASYDSGNGYVYVPNYGSATVSVINGTTSKVVATVPVGSNPTAATWDSGNGYVYVPNEQSANVSVLGATAYAVTFTEAGLPANTEWWVNVTGQGPQVSTTATITLHLADGGYTYAVSTVDKTYQASGGSFDGKRLPGVGDGRIHPEDVHGDVHGERNHVQGGSAVERDVEWGHAHHIDCHSLFQRAERHLQLQRELAGMAAESDER